MTAFTVTISSASYDEPFVFRLEPTLPVLRALQQLQIAIEASGDGFIDYSDDAALVMTEDEFVEFVLADLDDGTPGRRERLAAAILGAAK
jgi:hypothetical protein